MTGEKRYSVRGGDPRYMRGGDHSGETRRGEMDQVYRELDRLFAEFWDSTEPRNMLSASRVREKASTGHKEK